MTNPTLRFLPVLAALTFCSVAAAQTAPAAAPPAAGPVAPAAAPAPQIVYVAVPAPQQGPEELENYDDSKPPPPGYVATSRKRKGLIIGGAVTFGVSYTLAVLVGAAGADLSSNGNQLASLYVPLLGPFLQLARGDATSGGNAILIGDGIAQVGGAAMLVIGLAVPRTAIMRKDLVGGGHVQAAPLVARGMTGFGLSGSF